MVSNSVFSFQDDDTTNENNGVNELDLSDDEELAQALDLHSLIASSLSPPDPPPQTADQVIEEIDEIMQVFAGFFS